MTDDAIPQQMVDFAERMLREWNLPTTYPWIFAMAALVVVEDDGPSLPFFAASRVADFFDDERVNARIDELIDRSRNRAERRAAKRQR